MRFRVAFALVAIAAASLATGCIRSWPAEPGAAPEVVKGGVPYPKSLALYGDRIYWTSDTGVSTTLKNGDDEWSIHTGYAYALAVDETGIYFDEGVLNGRILRANLDGSNVVALAKAGPDTQPAGLAIDDRNVYFGTSAGLFEVPKGGGTTTQLYAGFTDLVTTDGDRVFFAEFAEEGVHEIPTAGGTEHMIVPAVLGARSLLVGPYFLYFGDIDIKRVPLFGGPIESFAAASYAADLGQNSRGIFWIDNDGLHGIARDGGTPILLTKLDQAAYPFGLVADETHVYWTDGAYQNGRILRMAIPPLE